MLVLLEPSRVGEQHTRSINEGTKQYNHKAREKRGELTLNKREKVRGSRWRGINKGERSSNTDISSPLIKKMIPGLKRVH